MKYIAAYFYGILVLIGLNISLIFLPSSVDTLLSPVLSPALMLWIFLSPLVLFVIYRSKKGKQDPVIVKIDETSVSKVAYVSVTLGILSFVPTLAFFLLAPILLFSIVTFLVFSFKRKQKSAQVALIGLLLSIVSLAVMIHSLS